MLAGAQFFVTPSLNHKTIEMARRYSRPIFPGGLTPTEILTAWEAGADGVKVFPCSAVGGAKYIKAIKAPFPHIDLIPTGGVNLDTIADFLLAGSTAVGVGGEVGGCEIGSQRRLFSGDGKREEVLRDCREAPAYGALNPTASHSGFGS